MGSVSYTHLDVYKRQALRIEEGHWEGDTVVGKRGSKEAVVPVSYTHLLVSFLESSEQTSRFGAAFKKPPPKRRFLVQQQGLEPGTR